MDRPRGVRRSAAHDTSHPSLAPPTVPGRSRRFQDSLTPHSEPRPRGNGALAVTAQVAASTGPVGGLVAAGVAALAGGGGDPRGEQLDAMWAMQRESQVFNLEYLALQEAIQSENRTFTTLSNLMKAQHDTAKSAVSNIRV